MTQEWAAALMDLGIPGDLVLAYNRQTGFPEMTLGELAAATGSQHETFHFVLNNTVIKDNRIPPYGMVYDEARRRNALPVPEEQYLGAGGIYNYWDDFAMNPPAGAVYATIDLLYQPTSWEYIQFLYLANNGGNPFLADEGTNLLDAWLATGMAEPYVMASASWGSPPAPPAVYVEVSSLATWCVDKRGTFTSACSTFGNNETVGIVAVTVADGQTLSGSQVFAEIRDPSGALVTSVQGFSDTSGEAVMSWKIPRRQAAGLYTITVFNVVNGDYLYEPPSPATTTFTVQ